MEKQITVSRKDEPNEQILKLNLAYLVSGVVIFIASGIFVTRNNALVTMINIFMAISIILLAILVFFPGIFHNQIKIITNAFGLISGAFFGLIISLIFALSFNDPILGVGISMIFVGIFETFVTMTFSGVIDKVFNENPGSVAGAFGSFLGVILGAIVTIFPPL